MREQFLRILTWCYNTLRNESSLTPGEAFRELNRLLYVRYVFEERKDVDIYQYINHSIIPGEDVLGELFLKVKEQFQVQQVFDASDKISVREETAFKLMGALHDIDFKSNRPALGEAYQDYIERVVKISRNRTIMPTDVMGYILDRLKLKSSEGIANPYCGYGGILTAILARFREKNKPALFGTDTDRLMAQTALLNMMLHGEPFNKIEYKKSNGYNNFQRYDVVITVLPYKEAGQTSAEGIINDVLESLKDGGRSALIVPDVILNKETYTPCRRYLMERNTIRNITSLPAGMVRTGSNNTLKMSIVFVEKGIPQPTVDNTMFVQVKSVTDSSLGIQKTNIEELGEAVDRYGSRGKTYGGEHMAWVSLCDEENWDVDAFFAKKSVKANALFPEYELGQLLKDVSYGSEEPNDKTNYKLVTVRAKQHDVVLREIRKGADIKTRPLRRIHEGQLLISRIGAKDGAIGIVPKELDGALVSGNFLILEINRNIVVPYYLVLAMSTTTFREVLASISRGFTQRSWLRFQELMECRIPVPDLQTQHDLIADMEGVQDRISRLEKKWKTGQEKFSKQIYGV